MTDQEEFEALIDLIVGGPVLKYTNQGDMYREIQSWRPQPKEIWMSREDFRRLWESVTPQQRYLASPISGEQHISWCGIPVKCLPQ